MIDAVDGSPAVEPQIGGHLVVAAPRGVQLAAGVAEAVSQGRLNVEMDIFLGGGELELAVSDLPADLLERLRDRVGLGHRHQAARGQHPRVGDRAVDVVVGQATIERDALGECLDPLVGRLTKHAAPCLLRTLRCCHGKSSRKNWDGRVPAGSTNRSRHCE